MNENEDYVDYIYKKRAAERKFKKGLPLTDEEQAMVYDLNTNDDTAISILNELGSKKKLREYLKEHPLL